MFLLLPLLFIGILFSRFFDKMDEKNTYSHYSRMDILTHYSPIYRGMMDSKKDFWQERFVLLIICLFLVIIHFYADLLINK